MKETGICEVCGGRFGIISWRRFCSKCKRTCCKDCLNSVSNGTYPNSSDFDRLKLCSDCLVAESTTQSISVHEDLEITGQINRALRLELKQKISSLENFRSFLLELSSVFGPNSDLLPHISDSDSGHSDPEDEPCDIGDLVQRCQSQFSKMQSKIRTMRKRYESSVLNEEIMRLEVERLSSEVEQLSTERDSLRSAVSRLDHIKNDFEDHKQAFIELSRECKRLKIRCKKLERLLHTPSKSNHNISRSLQENVPIVRRNVQRLRFWHSSSICPRFLF